MRLVFISALLPYPLFSGGQIRMYQLLKRMSKIHKISLFSFIRDDSERKYAKNLSFLEDVHMIMRGRAWQLHYMARAASSRLPFLMATYDNQTMRDSIRSYIDTHPCDLVHIEPFYVWPSVGNVSVPLVVSEHNIEYWVYGQYTKTSPIYMKPFVTYDVGKLRNMERFVWNRASYVVAVSDSDKKEIVAHAPASPVSVIPNGVDINKFTYVPPECSRDRFTVSYIGNFSWVQNRDAVDYLLTDIWGSIRKKYPGVKCRIVGKNPPSSLVPKAREQGITIETDVDDIRRVYASTDILLAPIRVGGGTKFKILEAMASGVPVIATKRGIEGINVNEKDHIWLAHTISDWVHAIDDIVSDPKHTRQKLLACRHLIESRYSWDNIARKLDTIWEQSVYEYKKH